MVAQFHSRFYKVVAALLEELQDIPQTFQDNVYSFPIRLALVARSVVGAVEVRNLKLWVPIAKTAVHHYHMTKPFVCFKLHNQRSELNSHACTYNHCLDDQYA